MKVYLTGVNIAKIPIKKSINKNNISQSIKKPLVKFSKIKDETNNLNEKDISSEQVKISFVTSKEPTSKTNNQLMNNNEIKNEENNKINNNNFISNEDKINTNKIKHKLLSEKDFKKIRDKRNEKKKNNEIMANELKDEYAEYIMFKEPKYADFDKISEEYQRQLYASHQKYNNNLLIIERKKAEVKYIVSLIEKSLVNNYWLKDSSMLPIYEKRIERVKLDILTKKQEYDGYFKLYEELYNKNYTIKRKVLDEIDIDTINNTFYDQYKILKNHAIIQVSKKQEVLSQIEEYERKMKEDYDKEMKQKNKTLKDLRLHIEVFKEDEKDLVNKLTKIKTKREEITELIKQKIERNSTIHTSISYLIGRYHRSFISMNKIFKSVNAQNLEDVLLDVGYIKHNFNKLRNRTIEVNKEITELNTEYGKLCAQLEKIKQDTINLEQKKKRTYKREDSDRVDEIREELKKLNEDKIKINEITQKSIGTFQKGIIFLFQKTKTAIQRIKPLKKVISPNLALMIKKYKNVPFSVEYNNINKDFLKNFAFVFFKFCHILFYLYLNSMSLGMNTNTINEKLELKSLYNKDSLNKYEAGMKKSLETFERRIKLKQEKQKELNSFTRKIEKEKKMKNTFEESSLTTQNKIFKKFINYLDKKEIPPKKDKRKNDYLLSKESSKNTTSFFFTGVDVTKHSHYNNKESSKNNSLNGTQSKFRITINKEKGIYDKTISYIDKKDFLLQNQNKFKNIFYKYQNALIKENERNLNLQKKTKKYLPRSKSQPRIKHKINFFRYNFPLTNKTKNEKEENTEKQIIKPKLMDDDYEYDTDENDQIKVSNIPLKKNKTFHNFTFFKLNKDRSNIYKKMNDLRVLQMAYFGGRFLNTNISSANVLQGSTNFFDDFVNNYFKRQNQENGKDKGKNKRANFRKKLVEKISANRKLRDKSSFLIKKRTSFYKKELKTNITYNKFRGTQKNKLSNSVLDKKSFSTTKNDRNINKYKRFERNNNHNNINLYSKSVSVDKIEKNNDKNKTAKNFRIKKKKI